MTRTPPFQKLSYRSVGEDANPFPGLINFTLDKYFINLCVKQRSIKYHFLSLWYDMTWDLTLVSRATGEHYIYIYVYISLYE